MTLAKILRLIIITQIGVILCISSAIAQEREPIRISDGVSRLLPIVIYSDDNGRSSLEFSKILQQNLTHSYMFRTHNVMVDNDSNINSSMLFTSNEYNSKIINFAELSKAEIPFLLIYNFEKSTQGLKIDYQLWDILQQKQIYGKEYSSRSSNWRRIAHLISNQTQKNLTGIDGYFDSRIIYVSEQGDPRNIIKKLAIIDQDGANHIDLSSGRDLVLTPRFTDSSREIIYLSFRNHRMNLYFRDLQTGQERVILEVENMAFSPRISPDGQRLALSISSDGRTDLYLYNISSEKLTQLTNHPAIDTAPDFSPDGRYVVFESDRGGGQQIYQLDLEDSTALPKRISFGKGRYATPIYSPDGKWIAFTKMNQGRFSIGIMDAESKEEQILTDSYLDEGPSWAPNSRALAFSRKTKNASLPSIHIVDIMSGKTRKLPTPHGASDPDWSGLLSQ